MIETTASQLPRSASSAIWLFAPALFLSALLMFLVEPMVGKMVLPLLGGAPAVWNTCVMFFQMTLLAGYAFAHVTSTRLRLQHQTIACVALFAIPFAALPFDISGPPVPHADSYLGSLVALVSYPFIVEPLLRGLVQRRLWAVGYGVFVAVAFACAWTA